MAGSPCRSFSFTLWLVISAARFLAAIVTVGRKSASRSLCPGSDGDHFRDATKMVFNGCTRDQLVGGAGIGSFPADPSYAEIATEDKSSQIFADFGGDLNVQHRTSNVERGRRRSGVSCQWDWGNGLGSDLPPPSLLFKDLEWSRLIESNYGEAG
jgi:hypothetical protein